MVSTYLLFCLVILGRRVAGQMTDAKCTVSAFFNNNSMGQSTCLIGAYLNSVCEEPHTEQALLPGNFYEPGATCMCNSVSYNMFSACAYCQGATWLNWTDWQQECSDHGITTQEGFPYALPSGVAVPHWAYYNYSSNANDTRWSTSIPHNLGEQPEVTGTAASQTTSPDSSMSTSTSATSNSVSQAAAKWNEAGVIAGSVIGGVFFIVLSALAIGGVLAYRRRVRRRDMAAHLDYLLPGMQSASVGLPFAPQKLYDPSDPSTFPTLEHAPTVTNPTGRAMETPLPAILQSPLSPTMRDRGDPPEYTPTITSSLLPVSPTGTQRPGGHYPGLPEAQ